MSRRPNVRRYERIGQYNEGPVGVDVDQAIARGGFKYWSYSFGTAFPDPATLEAQGRVFRNIVHQWSALEDFFIAYDNTGRQDILALLLDYVDSWLRHYLDSFSAPKDSTDEFVGYDLAVAFRFHRLAYIVDALRHTRRTLPPEKYVAALMPHLASLVDEKNFKSHNNHGLQQSKALLAGATRLLDLPGMAEAAQIAEARIDMLVANQFAADGVHKEHSPSYHLFLMEGLEELAASGLLHNPATLERIVEMRRAAYWMVDLRGNVASLGDSTREPSPPGAVELNAQRRIKGVEERGFEAGGYWFVKGTSEAGDTYLAQTCAFHSRNHKHADTGAFMWRDRGAEILVESGMYDYSDPMPLTSPLFRDGFWYSDRRRVYVEMTRAHNTVEVDGHNHKRRKAKAGGSTLTAHGRFGEVFASDMSIGTLSEVGHSRIVLLCPGQWLAVIDHLHGRPESSHSFKQWFHIHPRFERLDVTEGGMSFASETSGTLHVAQLAEDVAPPSYARGVDDPDDGLYPNLSGWYSPKFRQFDPCSSIAFEKRGQRATLATVFSFEPCQAVRRGFIANASGRSFLLRFKLGERRVEYRIRRERKGELQVEPISKTDEIPKPKTR